MAEDLRISQTDAADFLICDSFHAGGSGGDAESGTEEPQDGKPVRGLLDDLGAEAALLAETLDFLPCISAHVGREEDKWFRAQIVNADRRFRGQRVMRGYDGDVGLGQQNLGMKA